MAVLLSARNPSLEIFSYGNRINCLKNQGKEFLQDWQMLNGFTNANTEQESNGMDANAPENLSLYQDSSLSNSSDAVSPNHTSSIPTCVVAPTANDVNRASPDDSGSFIPSRKQREFIPENRKDDQYWEKRRKNNEAARKSREKRRVHDVVLENRILELTRDNCQLRNELYAIKKKYGIPLNETVSFDDESPSPRKSETIEKSVSPPAGKTASSVIGTGGYMLSNRPPPPPSIHIGNNQPPTMVPIQSAIPLPIPFQGNYNTKGSMPCYIAVSTSEGQVLSHSTATSLSSHSDTEQVQAPAPAHSQSSRRFSEKETSFGTNGRIFGTSGKPSVTQGNQSYYSPLTTSNPVSIPYSPSHMAATTTVQSMDNQSNSLKGNAYLSDEISDDNYSQDEPLSLTVRKRVDSFSGNESSNSYSSVDSPVSQSPPSMALPHKLRHKMPVDLGSHIPYSSSVINGLTQLSEIALAQSGPLPLIKRSKTDRSDTESSHGSGRSRTGSMHSRSMIDPKYAERRRRNNEAARKCRENRKTLTRIREAKSGFLETENGKLRSELDHLQEEMKQLKEMIDRKRLERNKDPAAEEASPKNDIKQEEEDYH